MGHLARGAGPEAPGEQVGKEQHGQVLGEPGLQSLQVGRAGAAQRDGQPGRLEHGGHVAAGPLGQHPLGVQRAQLLEDLLLALAEQLGQDAVDDDGRMRTVVSSRTLVTSSRVSLTGISSGVHTATSPVWRGSERISSIQSVWLRISPTLTRSLMAWGAASWPMMWPLAGASTTTRS